MEMTKKVYECKQFTIGYCGRRSFLIITKNKKPSIEDKIEAITKLLLLIDLRTEKIPVIEELKDNKWGVIAKW